MKIAVVGSGYVGLVAGACFADLGHEVILVDNDPKKLAALRDGQVPIHENFLPELLQRHLARPGRVELHQLGLSSLVSLSRSSWLQGSSELSRS